MSKEDDLKMLQGNIDSKQAKIAISSIVPFLEISDNYDEVKDLQEGKVVLVYAEKNSISSTTPSNDEVGIYAKFDGRFFKISLSEVTI